MTPERKQTKPKSAENSEPFTTEFENLDLPEPLLRGIRDNRFAEMTAIQRRSLPISLKGKDICGQAQTGTGKTAAFLITLFARMIDDLNLDRKEPHALILAPTRELAVQIYREGLSIGVHTDLRLAAVYGGEGYRHQENQIRTGVDIVIGTPGRLLDFARRRILNLSHVRFLVIDEADRLMDMGFWEELRSILRLLPRPDQRQSMLFSATLDHRTKRIAASYMNRPEDVVVNPDSIAADGIEQTIYHVERERKFELLLGILAKEEIPKGLLFTNMKVTAAWVVKKLYQHGYEVSMLTGDLRQSVRNRVLEKFKRGEIPLLVASDVASRGLHIDDVTHIINFDVPQDPEDYVHRIGRTARAGKKGKAYTLACDQYCYTLPDIEKLLGFAPDSRVPFEEDYGEDQTPEYTIRRMQQEEREKEREQRRGGRPGSHPSSRGKPRSGSGPKPKDASSRPESKGREGSTPREGAKPRSEKKRRPRSRPSDKGKKSTSG